jgi:hypothetical protein
MTTETQRRSIQHYLLYQGHACPTFDKEMVLYADRSPGKRIELKKVHPSTILEVIDDMTIRQIEDLLDADRITEELIKQYAKSFTDELRD